MIVAYILPGFKVDGIKAALVAAVVIGLVNATLGLVLKIVTFPLTILTLGLFWFVINGAMIYLASKIVSGFTIAGWIPAIIGGILLSLVNALLRMVLPVGK
jgi:putative membrane protein